MAKAIEVENGNEFKMGDSYFCPECKRTHTKGKIYKDHIKYIEDSPSKIEAEEESKNDEEIINLKDEIDDEDNFEDEDQELIEAFEELDDEDQEDADFEDDDSESISLDSSNVNGVNDSIKAVKTLPGVGDATLTKLIKSGFSSLEAIAYTPPSIIMEESGLGEKTTAKLIKASMEKLGIGFKSAEDIWERRKGISRISTGSHEVDDLLGGGVETGCLIEFFGEYRTGKTQLAHQLCVNVQLTEEKGGLEANALYIDTEGTFRPERIIQMSEALDLDYTQILKNIVFGRAYNSDHQILLIKEAGNLIKEKNIKLIIVDSLIGHFRSEYIGRGTLANRQQLINAHLHDLLRIAEIHNLAVIVTNQVQSKPDVFYGNPLQAAGGNIVAHGSTIRVFLRKGKGEQRIAKMVDAPHLPEGEAIFTITEDGIKDS